MSATPGTHMRKPATNRWHGPAVAVIAVVVVAQLITLVLTLSAPDMVTQVFVILLTFGLPALTGRCGFSLLRNVTGGYRISVDDCVGVLGGVGGVVLIAARSDMHVTLIPLVVGTVAFAVLLAVIRSMTGLRPEPGDFREILAAEDTADRVAQAIGDPGSVVPRAADESVPRWSTRAALAVLLDLTPRR